VLQQCVEVGMTIGVARIFELGGGGGLLEAIEGLGASPLEAWGRSPQHWVIVCNFSIKITYFNAYFDQNRYFKVITHQLL